MTGMKNNMEIKKIAVLGTGTWGTALSGLLAGKGHEVTAWSAIEKEVEELGKYRKHPNLPNMIIPESIEFTGDMKDAISDKDILLMGVPSVFVRGTAEKASKILSETGALPKAIVTVAKGVEEDTLMTMSQIIEDELSKALGAKASDIQMVALSGPTHAEEVSVNLPTAIVAASKDEEASKFIQKVFMTDTFRVYTNSDIDGVEICGAMKNVIALTVGISMGLGFGDNAKAALMTRGMEEIKRLGMAMGCEERTFSGLAGIGDLIVTATSLHSRNNRCGKLIGEGMNPADAVKEVGMVVEGLNALPAVIKLAEKYEVDIPVSRALHEIVNEGRNPKEVALGLMKREEKPEF